MTSEADAIDRYIERVAREEEDDLARKHGEFIISAFERLALGQSKDNPMVGLINEGLRLRQASLQEEDNQQ
jgi:hypothetical protein